MSEEPSKINSQTLIPLSFLTIIIGLVVWLASIKGVSESNKNAVLQLRSEIIFDKKELNSDKKTLFQKLDNIAQRLSNIEGFVKGTTNK